MKKLFASTSARLRAAFTLAGSCALAMGWSLVSQQASVAVESETSEVYSLAQAVRADAKEAIVIKHGWDIPTVSGIAQAINEVNNSPFDGIVFSGSRASRIFTADAIPESDIRNILAPMGRLNFTGPTHNYLIQYIASVDGGFSGPGYSRFIENARRLGRVAGQLGIEGIAFDNEVYNAGNPWDMSAACPGVTNTETCRRMAFNAGKEWMEAIQEGWPDVRLVSFFGPWLHDPVSYDWFAQYSQQNDWSGARNSRITCNFLAGIYAATVGNRSQYLDGGEIYSLRSDSDFAKTADWLRYFVPYVTPFFPEEYRADYHKNMGVAFGLFDDRVHLARSLPKVTPQIWGSMIRNAKRHAEVVWLYTEIHDWWRTDGNNWPVPGGREGTEGYVPDDWLNATRAAIQAD